jgi:outer membrane protein assembly factor BamB
MFRCDALHTGRSPFTGPATPVKKWEFVTGNLVTSSPAIGADGTIYVGSSDNNFYAINPDGTKKWEFVTGNMISSSPAIGSDGTIYIGSSDKKFYALNPDGTKKWEYAADVANGSPVIGTDGTIYVVSSDGSLYALNQDGTLKWSVTGKGYKIIPPALGADGTIYTATNDTKFHALNSVDGTQKWEFKATDAISASPAICDDGNIIVIAVFGIYSLNPDGTQKWKIDIAGGDQIICAPAISTDGTIYVGSQKGVLYAINPDGSQKWIYNSGITINSAPAIDASGTIYFGSGMVYALNPDGTKKWSLLSSVFQSSPAIGADGTIYIGANDKKVYAIGNGTQTLSITPPTAAIITGANQQFTATPAAGVTWSATGGTITTSGLFTAGNTPGTYVITAKSAAGTATASITINSTQQQSTITVLTPNGGEQWKQGTTSNIFWRTTGTPGNIKIELFKGGVFNRTITALTASTMPHSWTISASQATGNDYRIKVTSLNDSTVTDSSDADFSITTSNATTLSVPIQLLPAIGSANVAAQTTIAWQPVNNAVNYTLHYATNNNFTNPIVLTGTSTSATVSLSGNTRYYWRVKAADANNTESNWSSAWYFTTANQATQLTTPNLITPVDSTIDVPIKTTFTWSTVANVIAYEIELSKIATFTTKVVLGSISTSLTVPLANNQVYYWRVRGKSGNTLGTWSTIGTFTTAAFVQVAGVDIAIGNSKGTSPLIGFGVVNIDGSLQTVQVDQPINRQSEFNILVKNTGNIPDSFLITTTSIVNAKWKVSVFNGNGVDISKSVFSNGWTSNTVKPGEFVILRLRFSAISGQTIDTANPPVQSITIKAQSLRDITNSVATPANDTVIGTAVLVKMAK